MRKGYGFIVALAAVLAWSAGPTVAADDPAPKPTPTPTPKPAPPKPNPELATARNAITFKDWNAAITALSAAEQREPRNADVQNLLGYSHRNLGNLDLAFRHYALALQLEPQHLNTHEYMGEAYLTVANLAKAEEHLVQLQRFCAQACEQRDELERAIVEYKRRSAAAR